MKFCGKLNGSKTLPMFLPTGLSGQPRGYRQGGAEAAWQGTIFIVLIFLVLLHELGHVFAARYYGVPTRDVTLWPFGGIASMERMPDKPSQELVVALAGPAANVVIAAGLLLWFGPRLDRQISRRSRTPLCQWRPKSPARTSFSYCST